MVSSSSHVTHAGPSERASIPRGRSFVFDIVPMRCNHQEIRKRLHRDCISTRDSKWEENLWLSEDGSPPHEWENCNRLLAMPVWDLLATVRQDIPQCDWGCNDLRTNDERRYNRAAYALVPPAPNSSFRTRIPCLLARGVCSFVRVTGGDEVLCCCGNVSKVLVSIFATRTTTMGYFRTTAHLAFMLERSMHAIHLCATLLVFTYTCGLVRLYVVSGILPLSSGILPPKLHIWRDLDGLKPQENTF